MRMWKPCLWNKIIFLVLLLWKLPWIISLHYLLCLCYLLLFNSAPLFMLSYVYVFVLWFIFSFCQERKRLKTKENFASFFTKTSTFPSKVTLVLPHTTARTNDQGCSLESTRCHRRLTFAFVWLVVFWPEISLTS